MIVAKQLKKSFGAVEAVRNVTFDARDSEITGLLGPNGAGKTTTLRMLYSVLPADGGRILIDDIDPVVAPQAARRRLGVVPDGRGLYPRLTARENIDYFGQLHGLSRAVRRDRIATLSQTLDMGEILDRRVDGFSQGQRVKVAIARAMIHDPQTVILDEPSNGLDVMSTRALRGYLQHLKAEGRCVVLSTHIMQEVAALCDQVVVIARGEVAAQGSPQGLIAQSGQATLEDAFVSLIGSDEGLAA
jgi:sodium transport system ATP-binding protein